MAKKVTKVNEVSQLRPGAAGDILFTQSSEPKWATPAEAGLAAKVEVDKIKEDLKNKYTKAEVDNLIAGINTAEFDGPYDIVDAIAKPYDSNNLYLVGNAAPYTIYALIGEELHIIGNTGVDFDQYALKAEVSSSLESKVDKIAGKGLTEAEFTNEEKRKLATIAEGADQSTVFSVNDKVGTIKLTSNDIKFGDSNTTTTAAITNLDTIKVNKVDGKELSSNDFTDEHKAKLESLKQGLDGKDGIDGERGPRGYSAYEIAQQMGFTGTKEKWRDSLKGEKGETGARGPEGPQGLPGVNGVNGAPGASGKSNYQIAVANGYSGTEQEWLNSIKGVKGDQGEPGPAGVDGRPGERGLTGPAGIDGKSAYQLALDAGYTGSQSAWLASLKGEKGDTGPQGPAGNVTNIQYSQINGIPDLSVYALGSTVSTIQNITNNTYTGLEALKTRVTTLENQPTIPAGVVTDSNFNSKYREVPELGIVASSGDATLTLSGARATRTPLTIWNMANDGTTYFRMDGQNLLRMEKTGMTAYRYINMSNQRILSLGNPVDSTDAANKNYVDNSIKTATDTINANLANKLDVSKYRKSIQETVDGTTFKFGSFGLSYGIEYNNQGELNITSALAADQTAKLRVGTPTSINDEGVIGLYADPGKFVASQGQQSYLYLTDDLIKVGDKTSRGLSRYISPMSDGSNYLSGWNMNKKSTVSTLPSGVKALYRGFRPNTDDLLTGSHNGFTMETDAFMIINLPSHLNSSHYTFSFKNQSTKVSPSFEVTALFSNTSGSTSATLLPGRFAKKDGYYISSITIPGTTTLIDGTEYRLTGFNVYFDYGSSGPSFLSNFCLEPGRVEFPAYKFDAELAESTYKDYTSSRTAPAYLRYDLINPGQVVGGGTTVAQYSYKVSQVGIGYDLSNFEAIIETDGVYAIQAASSCIDVASEMAMDIQYKRAGTWRVISPEWYNSYPTINRGVGTFAIEYLMPGDRVRIRFRNHASNAQTRWGSIGPHTDESRFVIAKLSSVNGIIAASPEKPKLTEQINSSTFSEARVTRSGDSTLTNNREFRQTVNIPSQFNGRKIKISIIAAPRFETELQQITPLVVDVMLNNVSHLKRTRQKSLNHVDSESFIIVPSVNSNYGNLVVRWLDRDKKYDSGGANSDVFNMIVETID